MSNPLLSAFWFVVLMLVWGGLFTWVIFPRLAHIAQAVEKALLGKNSRTVSTGWGCLIYLGMIVVINLPIIPLLINIVFMAE